MDIQRAAEILEIELIKIVDQSFVKKQYHKLALQYHPDKNVNRPDCNIKFQEINAAYNYLKEMNDQKKVEVEVEEDTTYNSILNIFIQTIIKSTVVDSDTIFSIIKEIAASGCQRISLKLFEGLDKYTAIEIYEFISKYKNILHVSSSILEEVKSIILNKFVNDQLYILNPSIDDLFENNIYKITLFEKKYLVPLWHNELYFEGVSGEIIIKCIPELPENMSIDENNNLLVYLNINLTKELLNTQFIEVKIGKRVFNIQTDLLHIKKVQYITFKYEGISKIIEDDMYNIDKKADIIICCNLV
jgi:uncharacterized protein YajQ (UPF0234 family)